MLQNPPKYNMNYISNFLAMRNATGANVPMPPPPSSKSPHPIDCDVDETQLDKFNANTGKSFTIASILGLKKKTTAAMNDQSPDGKQKELNAINLSIHNAQNYPPVPNKAPFNVVDADQRFLPNRIPLAFAHHHMQASAAHGQHHPAGPHFYGGVNGANNNNNNNNNNMLTMNHNGASALQSLQQQFHAKSNQPFAPFHGKEQRSNKHETVSKSKSLKNKRVRTIFTPEQLERLEAEFERQQYMVGPERLYLAHTLQLTEAQVKVWFQNRRIKWRKHHLEVTQQRLAIIRQHQLPMPANAPAAEHVARNENPIASNHLALSPASMDFENASTERDASAAIDSEVSICSDSMDSDSKHDVDSL